MKHQFLQQFYMRLLKSTYIYMQNIMWDISENSILKIKINKKLRLIY